ncbi:class I SAM-dependent methyltransferase [Bdellovibrio bacteriovorus]|uniref:Methyltransferase domain-containing protein n=1 Tax=Bdellovibrio bacteriovorus str. Tiberius TaxID=1069642 RepID=K7YRN5_BDEBC|nr:class I SAM-dependent methyltransferase [Bdellovibrio bacteriovorus]AFY02531.1 hypothetical protein Bdt_2851 [Bdellovibrio bacteriovorus str. Tiberius]
MKNFDTAVAQDYDQDIRRKIPGYDLIQDLLASVLHTEFASAPHLLVAGSGTGEEMLRLGTQHPDWRMDGIEPSAAMIATAVSRTQKTKFKSNLRFFESTIQDYHTDEMYDGALSVLVSHFLPDDGQKEKYFAALAGMLKLGAPLIVIDMMKQADPVGDKHIASTYFWAKYNGMPEDALRNFPLRLRSMFFPITEDRLREICAPYGLIVEGKFVQSLSTQGFILRKIT